jgi:hypothetical protein
MTGESRKERALGSVKWCNGCQVGAKGCSVRNNRRSSRELGFGNATVHTFHGNGEHGGHKSAEDCFDA